MNNQTVFNKVVTHLRKQGIQSKSGDGCLYRGEVNGIKTMCAVGCLIPSNKYHSAMEGQSVGGSLVKKVLLDLKIDPLFAEELQVIHDNYSPYSWEDQFKKIAVKFGLKVPRASLKRGAK